MKLSEIDATLREIRVSPVKTLGPNFLHDRNLARWIVEKAELDGNDYVVEIGPGLGALTSLVLESGAKFLRSRRTHGSQTFCGSASPVRTSKCCMQMRSTLMFVLFSHNRRVKCFGNLPYYVSSQLLLKFIE